ncbi:DUF4163 domain-containing protein [Megasphaera paucivorans]|uniref:Uncharacterized protein n=1 Tax=Megasphaera paucivorans TaxID=349095 RepID=A0A1G9QFT4_9FIRM|nr:DUF4163 domain-containing protein [Megasphaera paucivorans]SDM09750.1 protein of unknown function [Megasphaera paucivorans]
MKKLFMTLTFILLAIPVFASVESGYQEDTNMQLSYPLVYIDNADAQEKINTDIASYVEKTKADYYSGWYKVKLSYTVKYEDNHTLSIILTKLRDGGGAHPQEHYYGLVYDKDTGDRIPISNFVNIASIDQWKRLAGSQIFPAYNWQWKQIYLMHQPTRISNDYYLVGQGIFYMIYQPYEVSSYANGMISVEFNSSNIDYLNRLNN